MFILIIFVGFLSLKTNVVQSKYTYCERIHGSLAQHKIIATWNEAQKQCSSEGAYLASPIDTEFLQELKSSMGPGKEDTYFFTGTKAAHYPGPFVSAEGVPIDDMPLTDMYELLDPRQGDCLAMNHHKIINMPCWKRLPFVCYTNRTKTPDKPTSECGTVPGYKKYSKSSCYKLHQEEREFKDAVRICAEEGGYLVVINDENEVTVIKNIENWRNGSRMYVGLSVGETKGDWRTPGGTPLEEVYHVWEEGHSPTDSFIHHCVVILDSGVLRPQRCHYVKPFLCEKGVANESDDNTTVRSLEF